MTIELTPEQSHVVVEMDRLMRRTFQTKTFVVGIFLNFRKQYIKEVIPEKSKAKKYSNHEYYQRLIKEQEGLREAFETFDHYNSGYRDLMVRAFFTGDYETPILFKRNQLVLAENSNTYAGFVGNDVLKGQKEDSVEIFSDAWMTQSLGKFKITQLRSVK